MTVKNVIVLAAVLGATGWYFTKHRTAEPQPLPLLVERDSANFRCEGKTHCSEMASCEEATYLPRPCVALGGMVNQ
jgi:hypothetical protein